MEARRLAMSVSLACFAAMGLPALGGPNVEIVVESSLYAGGEITAGLDQYLADIAAQGYNGILTTQSFASPADLRSHLANRYNDEGLEAVVLIGDLPVQYFERENDYGIYGYQRFPVDLYFQDLDGTWSDGDLNATLDTHTGNVAPEIALGRIVTSSLTGLHPGRTEAGMLNDYFQKNHAYRTEQLNLAPNGLAYIDDDWAAFSSWPLDLGGSLAGSLTTVKASAVTTADDYESRLTSTEYESILLAVHSNTTVHVFEGGTAGTTTSSELMDLNPQAFFYNLFTCSSAKYTADGYMAGEYIFGTEKGLLAVGTTKIGGMKGFGDYYGPLGEGDTFGQAMLEWWQKRAWSGFTSSEIDWHYGMTIIGDPLLTMQAHRVPEPAVTALLGMAWLWLGRRRRR